MEKIKRSRRRYDAQFRMNAVDLIKESGRSVTEAARDLGVPFKTLVKWVHADRLATSQAEADAADPGRLRRQIEDLERKLAHTERQRDILKKALAICSNDPDATNGSR